MWDNRVLFQRGAPNEVHTAQIRFQTPLYENPHVCFVPISETATQWVISPLCLKERHGDAENLVWQYRWEHPRPQYASRARLHSSCPYRLTDRGKTSPSDPTISMICISRRHSCLRCIIHAIRIGDHLTVWSDSTVLSPIRRPFLDPVQLRMNFNTGPPSSGPSPTTGEPPPLTTLGYPRPRLQRTNTLSVSDVSSPPSPKGGSFTETGSARHDQRRLELDRETPWLELPVINWFERCTPGDQLPDGMTFDPFVVDLKAREQGMYHGLGAGLDEYLHKVGWADYEALVTGRFPDNTISDTQDDCERNVLRPDLGIYPRTERTSLLPRQSDARVIWASAEVLVEVKHDLKHAPFSSRYTPRSSFLPSGRERCLSRGQLVEYAAEVFARQHRDALFVILFLRDCARLVRFDRAGALVSEEFDYVARPEILGSFLYRLSKMSMEDRGHDPTAVRASEDEEVVFRTLHERYPEESAVGRGLRNAATEGWPVYKLSIDAPFSPNESPVRRDSPSARHQFLVGKPVSTTSSLVGKGNKGFVAYNLTTEQVVYIKDTWRLDRATRSEYETYLRLRENVIGELYIPTLLGGGDVRSSNGVPQRTSFCGTNHSRVHARLVFKEICRPLDTFTNSFELVKVVTWALIAHAKAWRECNILHRDISADSILVLDMGPLGIPDPVTTIEILADWELATQQPGVDDPGGASDAADHRSWPFMSARLQTHPAKPHELADDLESFMHVLGYFMLKYLSRSRAGSSAPSDAEIAHLVQCMYDAFVFVPAPNGCRKGSALKLEKVQNGTTFVDVSTLAAGHPMSALLTELSLLCKLHYEHVEYPPSSPLSLSRSDVLLAGGSVCGSQVTMPDYDFGFGAQKERFDSGGESELAHCPARHPTMSPLRDHDSMVRACMSAIKKVWPRVDRFDAVRTRSRVASTRNCKRRTSELSDGSVSRACKRARTLS
ncbi:hypothetical protein C8Q74DRAFT_1242404 [Fomes fomentarius]|nr:hypothetical protein C8Q74DRAFT_1242404 [Fomes fomentarius]